MNIEHITYFRKLDTCGYVTIHEGSTRAQFFKYPLLLGVLTVYQKVPSIYECLVLSVC